MPEEEHDAMLKITHAGDGEQSLLRVEGKLLGAWVGALAAACAGVQRAGADLRLDLSALTFADDDGARLLRELLDGGAQRSACSGSVAALLRWSRP
jgi:hypothetical protein